MRMVMVCNGYLFLTREEEYFYIWFDSHNKNVLRYIDTWVCVHIIAIFSSVCLVAMWRVFSFKINIHTASRWQVLWFFLDGWKKKRILRLSNQCEAVLRLRHCIVDYQIEYIKKWRRQWLIGWLSCSKG